MQGAVGLIPGWGARNTCLVAKKKKKKKKQNKKKKKQNFNKFNKDFKFCPHQKNKKKKKAQHSGEF